MFLFQDQQDFLCETHRIENISIGNDSIINEDICSPAVPENLTSVIELKYNELETNYQSLVLNYFYTKNEICSNFLVSYVV